MDGLARNLTKKEIKELQKQFPKLPKKERKMIKNEKRRNIQKIG